MKPIPPRKGFAVDTPLTDRERIVLRVVCKNPDLIPVKDWDILMDIIELKGSAKISKTRHALIRTYEVILVAQYKLSN